MKKILILVTVLFAGICFSSCSKDETNKSSLKQLEGMWIVEDDYCFSEYRFFQFSNNTVTSFSTKKKGFYYDKGYVFNCNKEDLREECSGIYELKNDGNIYMQGQGLWFFKISIIDNNTIFIDFDGGEDYNYYYKVKGFK